MLPTAQNGIMGEVSTKQNSTLQVGMVDDTVILKIMGGRTQPTVLSARLSVCLIGQLSDRFDIHDLT